MQDLLWIGITVTFFVLSIAYVRFCERATIAFSAADSSLRVPSDPITILRCFLLSPGIQMPVQGAMTGNL